MLCKCWNSLLAVLWFLISAILFSDLDWNLSVSWKAALKFHSVWWTFVWRYSASLEVTKRKCNHWQSLGWKVLWLSSRCVAVRTHRIISTFPQCWPRLQGGAHQDSQGQPQSLPCWGKQKQKQKTAMRQLKIHQGTKHHRFIQFPSMSTGLQCPMWNFQVNGCLRYLHITYAYPAILLKPPLDYLQY